MEWYSVLSLIFGAGGVGTAIVMHLLDRKKYREEVRDASAEADAKEDEFWKKRYDVLQAEVENKDIWWKERYDTLYKEYQNERHLSNDIIKSFRTELNEMRTEYEKQREAEKSKYDTLVAQYKAFEEESIRKEHDYREKICQLEQLVNSYEKRLGEGTRI